VIEGRPLLHVSGLEVDYQVAGQALRAVRGVDFQIAAGECFAIVGESGCGKSSTAKALIGLLPSNAGCISRGQVLFEGRDLISASATQLRRLCGSRIGFVPSDPLSSLNPMMTVGGQITEVLKTHLGLGRTAATIRAIELLDMVGIPDADKRASEYPHRFSGGMRQRAMTAIAIACDPSLLILDEPTTALDVTIQAQILELLADLQQARQMAILLISHDLGVVANLADEAAVMYAGRFVEQGSVAKLFDAPRHPYTHGLLNSLPARALAASAKLNPIPGSPPDLSAADIGCAFKPRCRHAIDRCGVERPSLERTKAAGSHRAACFVAPTMAEISAHGSSGHRKSNDGGRAVLELRDLTVHFAIRSGIVRRKKGVVRAVDGVTLSVLRGETVGVVGESGSGKSTLARAALLAQRLQGGSVTLNGDRIDQLTGREQRIWRRHIQLVFQDATASLDPRIRIGEAIAEPLQIEGRLNRAEIAQRVEHLLGEVGLDAQFAGHYPHELSGGQRQRVGIARALATEPMILVCDEPTSSLDVSVQAQVVNLLRRLQSERSLSIVFISHDISLVQHLSDRIAVMYLGRIVEEGAADEVCENPTHPYTAALLSSVLNPLDESGVPRIRLTGDTASAGATITGCRFRTRCWLHQQLDRPDRCAEVDPVLAGALHDPDHRSACLFQTELQPALRIERAATSSSPRKATTNFLADGVDE
jgi:peptide/nickel transport system ATP-binding protein